MEEGLDIIGSIGASKPALPTPLWSSPEWTQVRPIASTSLLIALLGYFESSVTVKSLSSPRSKTCLTPKRINPNRELSALGLANCLGGCFTTLPAFGGFGRSKLNVQAGGLTPMSSIYLSLISLACALLFSPCLYYVPKPTLAAMSCAVGISMVEECQHTIFSLCAIHAWPELGAMVLIASSMLFHSLALGVEVGLCMTVLKMAHSATRSRAETDLVSSTQAEHSIRYALVQTREAITFANVEALVDQARQCVSPAQHTRCLLIDCYDVPEIDACSTQMLVEMVKELTEVGMRVVFVLPTAKTGLCRIPRRTCLSLAAHLATSRAEAEALVRSFVL